MSNDISVENSGNAVIIKFTNPSERNPLSRSLILEMHKIVDEIANGSTEFAVFTGSDGVFASGANLREIALLTGNTAPEFAMLGQTLMNKISALPQKTIAAVNGFCFGGALDLALACDRRIASHDATFAHPGTGLGIITGWGGTQRLPRLIGRGCALEMLFTAAAISAERALHIGLVDTVVDDIFNVDVLKMDIAP